MSRYHHSYPLRDSRPDQVTDCGTTEVVPEFTRKPSTLTSGAPCLIERLHFPAVVVEDEGTFRVARQMLLPLLF
jgi:hypothetical protein